MYKIVKNLYQLGKITALEVWGYVDKGKITAEQAAEICGARPTVKK